MRLYCWKDAGNDRSQSCNKTKNAKEACHLTALPSSGVERCLTLSTLKGNETAQSGQQSRRLCPANSHAVIIIIIIMITIMMIVIIMRIIILKKSNNNCTFSIH